ncbi:MAG: hypothetical protein R3C11_24735 [Planctomycetaceae bacterium]
MLSQAICQSNSTHPRTDNDDPSWSSRAKSQFAEIREEFPWISAESTSVVLQPNGELRWWTFAGGVANTLLADALKPHCDVKGDNLLAGFPQSNITRPDRCPNQRDRAGKRKADFNTDAMENLKFSECLSEELSAEVFTSRFNDRKAVEQVLQEKRRVSVVQ